jgi:hypothetical protein
MQIARRNLKHLTHTHYARAASQLSGRPPNSICIIQVFDRHKCLVGDNPQSLVILSCSSGYP